MKESTVHVALVGMTGVGKSTLTNVLIGEENAKVSNDVRPCTTKTMRYELVEEGTRYCIWDTRGLNEASERASIFTRLFRWIRFLPDADRESRNLLRSSDPRVNLVLLCIDARKIKVKEHWKIYNKIYSNFCKRKLKVAVVVIGERDFRSSGWKATCVVAAQGVAEEFPDAGLIEVVPQFEGHDDPEVEECKRRILGLITNACGSLPVGNEVERHY